MVAGALAPNKLGKPILFSKGGKNCAGGLSESHGGWRPAHMDVGSAWEPCAPWAIETWEAERGRDARRLSETALSTPGTIDAGINGKDGSPAGSWRELLQGIRPTERHESGHHRRRQRHRTRGRDRLC